MGMLNFHDGECDRYTSSDPDDGVECTCPPEPPRFPGQESFPVQESAKVITDQNTRLCERTMLLPVEPQNPFPVLDDQGKTIGTAVVSFAPTGLAARFILDPHNPAAFDLDIEPARVSFRVSGTLENGVLSGQFVILSK